ncbi:phytanoyl-CoA dioxygenase family protein [Aestuariimicrobium kwangyangense]|uniref:phytanoyl-CoA dioxygenase family protein n=1 Tax=Aestuariimicrobium kwangyangense TaxID=396389 RepID=UPI0003B31CC0|nr:phytanoyl-CoA dioxygenase family protein [Aestuariimicrobium kwangyangense]
MTITATQQRDLTAPSSVYDPDQLADYARQYNEQGFVRVRGLLSKDEAAAYRAETHRLLAALNRGDDPTWASAAGVAGGQKTSLQHLHDAQFYSSAFTRLLVDPRFTEVATAALGTPNLQLHHTKAFVKPPANGSPFPFHQDHPFFPHRDHKVGAVIFHFDDAPVVKGCVRVVPGSHLAGPLEHDPEGSFHLNDIDPTTAVDIECEAGDAIFFPYLTVHASGVNVSDEARTTWLVQFRDPADRPTVKTHDHSLGQGLILAGVDPTGRSGGEPPAPAAGAPAMMGG